MIFMYCLYVALMKFNETVKAKCTRSPPASQPPTTTPPTLHSPRPAANRFFTKSAERDVEMIQGEGKESPELGIEDERVRSCKLV